MNIYLRKLYILFITVFIVASCFAQTDSSQTKLKFDLGWTRNRNINLWPFFKRSITKESFDLQVLVPFYAYHNNQRLHEKSSHLFPVYFKDSTQAGTDLRLFSACYPSLIRVSRDNIFETHTFKFLELVPHVNFFEITKSASGTVIQNNLFFFLFYNNNVFLKRSYFVFFPVYWSFKNPERNTSTLFPIYSKGTFDQGSGSYLAVTPLFWHIKSGDDQRNILFPIIWSRKDKYKSMFTLPPLLFTIKWADKSKSKTMVTPFFWHTKKNDITRNYFIPLWWQGNYKGLYPWHYNIIFPLYWSIDYSSHHNRVLFPVYWNIKDDTYKSLTIMPFFSYGRSKDSISKHIAVTPLFWHISSNEKPNRNNYYTHEKKGYKNILFPLWWNGYKTSEYNYANRAVTNNNDTSYYNVIFPVYWHIKNTNNTGTVRSKTNNLVLFPLLWKLNNPQYQSFTFEPFFSVGHSPDNKSKHISITPFWWHFETPEEYRNVFFPLVLGRKKYSIHDTIKTTIILPVYWAYKNKESSRKVLFPVIWTYKSEHRKSFSIFPVLFYAHNWSNSHLVMLPFLHFKTYDGHRNILFPFWWEYYHTSTINNVLYESHSNVFFPLYWSIKNGADSKSVFFPLLWISGKTAYKSVTFVPLFSTGHSPDHKNGHLAVTPLFWHFWKPGMNGLSFHPLFNYYKDSVNGVSKFNMFYFIYRYKSLPNRTLLSFIWPLCEYDTGPAYTYFRFSPLIWYKKSAELNYFSIQPFYYQSSSNEEKSMRIFWELLTWKRELAVKTSVNFCWKLITSDKYDNKDHEFRILYWLYADMNKNGNIEKSLLPLYHIYRYKNGDKSFSTLFSFYHSSSRKVSGTNEYYKEVKIFWFIRLLSNYNALKAKGIDVKAIKKP